MNRFAWTTFACLIIATTAVAQKPASPRAPSASQPKPSVDMMAWMEQASQPLTQDDVRKFLKAVDVYLQWVSQDAQRRAMFARMPPPMKQAKIIEILGEKAGPMEKLLFLEGRVLFAESASKPNVPAQMKNEVSKVKAKMAATEAQLATMPQQQQAKIREQMNARLKLMEAVANYPAASIAIFKQHEVKLMSAIQRLADEKKWAK